jgi:hypothetical protein|tara:strand:+ start:1180 stop:1344 length:165 start_codon:yes stop_codon:yes gene_type:complete
MSPASWEVERKQKEKLYSFKFKLKQLSISNLSEQEYKDAIEKIYMEVFYPEERI